MPSVNSIASFALALAALSLPAYASVESSEMAIAARAVELNGSVFARHQLQKRRVNHAFAYGYPFHQGPHSGTGKMTPGGYVAKDKHPENIGAACKRDSECHTKVSLSAGKCEFGVCTIRCLGDTIKQGNDCIGVYAAAECKKGHNCPKISVDNAFSVCVHNKCTFACDDGYYASGDSCVKDNAKCGHNSCLPIENGSNTCVDGKCSPACETYLGYQLYTNEDETIYKCIDIKTDPENCGGVGAQYACPSGYNHKGSAYCSNGHCGLNCHGYKTTKYRHGVPYCTDY